MMNTNIMIGTAILSMYSDKQQKDSIDLMLPFVKYTLHEKYSVGSVVSASDVCDYIRKEFSFENLPLATIEKTLKRLSASSGCLTRKNHEYTLNRLTEEDHTKFKLKYTRARENIDSIIQALTPYINSRVNFKKYNENDARNALFAFLDKYGLSTYENKIKEQNVTNRDQIQRTIGMFILQENEKGSHIFENLLELIKGIFLSKALYLQTENKELFNSRMKNTTIILDAPLLLRILGLKSEGENRKAKEFLQMLPTQVNLHYFQQNFDELQHIIRTYKSQRIYGGKYTQTLEYFDEVNSSVEEIDQCYIQLEKKLRGYNVTEYNIDDIPADDKYSIDTIGLQDYLKEKIPAYNNNERALENDIATISYVYRLRRGRKPSSIENCRVIFVTNNLNLVKHVNSFLGEPHVVGCAMTEIDFTILMWLKSNRQNKNVPKEILVANALAATEEVTENFMEGVLEKIKNYQKEGTFDEENAGLILENIYYRRELVDKCNGNPEELSVEIIQSAQEKYEYNCMQKAGYDNLELKNNLKTEIDARKEIENRHNDMIDKIINRAKTTASKRAKAVKSTFKIIIVGLVVGLCIFGIYATIKDGLTGDANPYGISALVFAALGIVDLLIGNCRFTFKIVDVLANKIYDRTYREMTSLLQQQSSSHNYE